ncbi:ankyrin repeat domain-containing protein [Nonomuraea sp. K274]|uniref:Ankyrin repeat domain-containing protein n=1 Tax=Nonomuraea cypriaca TaxID=1187855 RepID=A0A931F2P5_9ACTN|nr:ankyrin repeat domain-containing protein [Nonomuraea cypriaca]MBF8191750.1 ankyrin repeat domain-containing protein [Nonomuraea cypriaca]
MIANETAGWSDFRSWEDLALVRARLDAGADPNEGTYSFERPLHAAAERGSPEVVAELAGRVDDVDAECEGRTALWDAVFNDRPENARALVAAGADPWRPMMGDWSPGRLSLAGPTPGQFFPFPPGHAGLSEAEAAAVTEADRLTGALGDALAWDGFSLACVGGISAAEAARRLAAEPSGQEELEEIMDDPSDEEAMLFIGLTDVPGGCVVSQQWGYMASTPVVMKTLSAGTVAYGMYANPKSGNQGSVYRDGDVVAWDTHPGGGNASSDDPAEEILLTYLYEGHAEAYCFAGAGLHPADTRALTDPDTHLRLPERDYWH